MQHCAMQRNWNIVLGQFLEQQRYTDMMAARQLMQNGPCDLEEFTDRELFVLTKAMFDDLRGSIKAPFSKGLDHLRSVQDGVPLWPGDSTDGGAGERDDSGVSAGGHAVQGAGGNVAQNAGGQGGAALGVGSHSDGDNAAVDSEAPTGIRLILLRVLFLLTRHCIFAQHGQSIE